MIKLIDSSIPSQARLIRVHTSGDFFNARYYNAFNAVARRNKSILFYAYTKRLQFLVDSLHGINPPIPGNFKYIAVVAANSTNILTATRFYSLQR